MRNEIANFKLKNKELLKLFIDLLPENSRETLKHADSVEFIRKGEDTLISFVKFEENNEFLIDGHLGGCSRSGDPATWTPGVWDFLIENLNVQSVIDIGCGFGHSTEYFSKKIPTVTGVEGSSAAVNSSLVKNLIDLHDYSESPYIPSIIFDLAWSCEFVEHVEERFMQNFIETFKKSKYVAMTYASPGQGGHHHVNEQPESYWIEKMQRNGFHFMSEMTQKVREVAFSDGARWNPIYSDNHFAHRGLIFKNEMF
jgi:SAM-dependent methyltransferase